MTGGREPGAAPRRIFLSVAGPDEEWGHWLDHVLRTAGYEVDYYRRSFPLGSSFVDQIDAAMARADRMVAALSPAYLDRASWAREEWQAGIRIAHDRDGFLLPVMIEDCAPPPLLGAINRISLVDLDRAAAQAELLRGVRDTRPARGDHEPPFPGYTAARYPGPDGGLTTGRGAAALPDGAGPGVVSAGVVSAGSVSAGSVSAGSPRVGGPGVGTGGTGPGVSLGAGARAGPPGPATPPPAGRESITLLHLPTLAAPPRPGHVPSAGPDPYGSALYDDLAWLGDNQGIRPDAVILTGLALEGRRGEYERAADRLAGLAGRLSLPTHRIALMPGRGDVSAAAARAYFAGCEDDEVEPVAPYWRKWRHFVDFHAAFYRDLPDRTFAVGQEWTLYPMPDLRLVVAGLNSTMAMSHRQEDDHGEVGQAQAQWFAEQLAGYEQVGWLRVAAGHHPPMAADRMHSAMATDATSADLIVGGRVNLLLAAHGHGAPRVGASLPMAPARLPGSNTALIAAHAPFPVPTAQSAVRYQLVRLTRTELTRVDRRFSRRSGAWRPAEEAGPAGMLTHGMRWERATGTFPRPVRRSGPAGGEPSTAGNATADGFVQQAADGLTGDPDVAGRAPHGAATFADRVAEIARLTSTGATITRIEPIGPTPGYLRVTVPAGPVREQHPVGLAEDGADQDLVDRFVERVHRPYAATDPQLVSDLVYGGALPAPRELVTHAFARGVRLRSFVEYQGLLDLRDYLRRQSERLAADRRYPPSLYLPQRYRLLDGSPGGIIRAGDAEAGGDDLLEQLVEWLTADTARFVLVLGDFGRGKTFCLRELARTLPERRPHLIPLLIDLRTMEKAHSVDELVAAHLVSAGEQRVDVAVFRYMLRRGRLVLLFDGFDELALRVTYETAAEHLGRLLDAVDGQAKVVVTSRTQHFLSHGQVRGALGNRVELMPASRIAELGDFTADQIREFLVRLYDGDTERALARLGLIHDIRDLLGLSHNPRMLGFIASLDTDRLRAVQARTGMISSADLYAELIDTWLRYEEHRARPPGAGPTLTAAERRDLVTALALRLWRTTDQTINLSELTTTASAALDEMTDRAGSEAGQLDSGQVAHLVGSGSLLVRDQLGGFTFIHQSVMEYLVASAAAVGLGGPATATARGGAAGGRLAGADVLAARPMSPLMIDFFRGAAGDGAAAAWARRVLADEEAGQAARANALAVARQADPASARGARLAGAQLEGADLTGLDLAGADLADANLTEANLDDADLTGARLRGARLARVTARGVRLRDADLTAADLRRSLLVDADLTGAELTGSRWDRAALLGPTPADRLRAVPELAAAAIPGRDPVEVVINSGIRWSLAISPALDLVAYGSGHDVTVADLAGGRVLAVLRGPGEMIRELAFTADSALLADGSVDGTVRLWDVAAAELRTTLRAHSGGVRTLAFSPDGRLLATGGADGAVRLWEVATGAQVDTIEGGGPDYQIAAAFAPDGTVLAYGTSQMVGLWDLRTAGRRRQPRRLPAPAGRARPLRFSADGGLLAVGGSDHTVWVWNVAADRELGLLAGHTGYVRAVAFAAEARLLAAGSNDGGIRVWDLDTGRPRSNWSSHTNRVLALEFADPAGETLLAGSADGSVRVWRTADGGGTSRTPLASRANWVLRTAFVPGGPLVAAGGEDGVIRLWDTNTAEQVGIHAGDVAWLYGMTVRSDGRLLATAGGDGVVRMYALDQASGGEDSPGHQPAPMPPDPAASGPVTRDAAGPGEGPSGQSDGSPRPPTPGAAPVRTVATGRRPARSVAFSPDGRTLAVGNPDGSVGLWDPRTCRRLRLLKADGRNINSVAFSPDGTRLAAGTDRASIHLWDAAPPVSEPGGPRPDRLSWPVASRRYPVDQDWVNALAFSPDGRWLACACGSGTVWIMDSATGAVGHRLDGHLDRARTVAYSPDGALLATGGADGAVRLWDPESGQETAQLLGHTEQVWSVAFDETGTRLVSGSDDGTTRLWDAVTGRELATMLGLPRGRWATVFPDGSYKSSGPRDAEAAAAFWWSIRLCRFEPDELAPYVPHIRRLALGTPVPVPSSG